MKCIVCLKDIDNFIGQDQWISSPTKGTLWASSGNYGSGAIDNSRVDYGVDEFRVIICDVCILNRAELVMGLVNPEKGRKQEPLKVWRTLRESIDAQAEEDDK